MTDRDRETLPDDHDPRYILPAFAEILGGYGCAKLYCEESPGFECGCPSCLSSVGKTLVYNSGDYIDGGKTHDWARHVVSERLGMMVPERICPNYPGWLEEVK